MATTDIEIFYPKNTSEWRNWLIANHERKQAVWVVFYKKNSEKPTITWSQSVDEALCFGWIDSKKIAVDHEKSHQYFSKRKPKSIWSKINIDKVTQLISDDKMTPAGLKCIEIAQQNGSWNLLDTVDALLVPDDLEQALLSKSNAKTFFEAQSKSAKKMMLYWLVSAKTTETRCKRINLITESCQKGEKPKGI
jgi:uncharacterized protein YdeI (YjbR/CyaY-like superfamily)